MHVRGHHSVAHWPISASIWPTLRAALILRHSAVQHLTPCAGGGGG